MANATKEDIDRLYDKLDGMHSALSKQINGMSSEYGQRITRIETRCADVQARKKPWAVALIAALVSTCIGAVFWLLSRLGSSQ